MWLKSVAEKQHYGLGCVGKGQLGLISGTIVTQLQFLP
jgi:hypothetical protein